MSPEDEVRMRRIEERLEEVAQRLEVIEGRFQREFRWAATLDAYPEKVILEFLDEESLDKALEILHGSEKTMPHAPTGGHTIIVPKEAIGCFEGLNFTVHPVD